MFVINMTHRSSLNTFGERVISEILSPRLQWYFWSLSTSVPVKLLRKFSRIRLAIVGISFVLQGRLQKHSASIYIDLCVLRHHFDHTKLGHNDVPSSSVLDLSAGCQRLGNVLRLQLLGSGLAAHIVAGEPDLTGLDMRTLAEKNAENLLLSPNTLLLTGPDAACSAVMGAAVAVGALGPAPMAMKCCAHCSGEVKLV